MLSNSAYIARPAWNQTSIGKYTKFQGGRHVRKNPGDKRGRQAAEDHVRPDKPLFEPVVPLNIWNAVQNKLANKPQQKKAPRSSDIWLAGVVYCANCGGVMHGAMMKTAKGKVPTLMCGTANRFAAYKKSRGETCPCKLWRIRQSVVEAHLNAYLSENGVMIQNLAGAMSERTIQNEKWWRETLTKMATAYEEMEKRVGKRGRSIWSPIPPETFEGTDGKKHPVPYWTDDRIEKSYRELWASERNMVQAEYDQKETEHTKLTLAYQELPTPRAKEKAKTRLVELEAELSELESRLKNAADEMAEARSRWQEAAKAWHAAARALESEGSSRQRAAAVRQVIERVNLTFQPTGKRHPLSYVSKIEIIPRMAGREDLTKCELEFPRKSKAMSIGWE